MGLISTASPPASTAQVRTLHFWLKPSEDQDGFRGSGPLAIKRSSKFQACFQKSTKPKPTNLTSISAEKIKPKPSSMLKKTSEYVLPVPVLIPIVVAKANPNSSIWTIMEAQFRRISKTKVISKGKLVATLRTHGTPLRNISCTDGAANSSEKIDFDRSVGTLLRTVINGELQQHEAQQGLGKSHLMQPEASENSGMVASIDAFMFFFIFSTSDSLSFLPKRLMILAVATFHLILAALPLSIARAAAAALAT